MDNLTVYDYIKQEEAAFPTIKVPVTNNKEWNFKEHVDRCTNVANGWFHTGKDDDTRPYNNIVTPIVNVALRSEGFDVKDVVPYVNRIDQNYKSFLVKKYHPQWARKHGLDTFFDDLVKSSVIYDLALIKNCNDVRPEVVPLQQIAFCDQTNILSGPLCLKHQYSSAELLEYKGKWYDDKIDEAITLAKPSKVVSPADDKEVKTPGKYIEAYELHGMLPDSWLDEEASPDSYSMQMHIVCFYTGSDNKKHGITLFKGPEKDSIFEALVINEVYGRACGVSIVEYLFEPQMWNNYDGIRIKELLDAAAVVLFQSADDELEGQKLSNLKNNTVVKHGVDKPITKMDTTAPNITSFQNHQIALENNARVLGSASDAQLGTNPVSGTPFALQNLVVQQGQGIHEFRQGKIASFVADRIYPKMILKYLVDDMNGGKKFSEELTLDEMQEIVDAVVSNEVEEKIKEKILETGKVPTNQEREVMKKVHREEFMKKGTRRFMETLEGELEEIPEDVFVNIVGKSKYMAQDADKLTNIIRAILPNPQVFAQLPGLGKVFNELLENSGLSPIDFSQITTAPETQSLPEPSQATTPAEAPVAV